MTEDKELKDLIEELKKIRQDISKREEMSNTKEFKMPYKGKVNKSKKKNGWITVFKVNNNSEMEAQKHRIEENTYLLDGIPRIATPEHILKFGKHNVVIQPSWSVKPFSPADSYDNTIKEKMGIQGYRLILNRMKSEVLSAKKKIGFGLIIGAIVAIIVIGYFVSKGGAA